ncbi:MAG: putative Ig domain-containing protein, partial [Bacteroidota bacterium]
MRSKIINRNIITLSGCDLIQSAKVFIPYFILSLIICTFFSAPSFAQLQIDAPFSGEIIPGNEGEAGQYQVVATDPDPPMFQLKIYSMSVLNIDPVFNGSINWATGLISWGADQAPGIYDKVTISVSYFFSGQTSVEVDIQINHKPRIDIPNQDEIFYYYPEDEVEIIGSVFDNFNNFENDFPLIDPFECTITPSDPGFNVSLVDGLNGEKQNPRFYWGSAQTGVYTIKFKVTDNAGSVSDLRTFQIIVYAEPVISYPPEEDPFHIVKIDNSYETINEGISTSIQILADDADLYEPHGDNLFYEIIAQPAGSEFIIDNYTGEISLENPEINLVDEENTSWPLTVKVSDSYGNSDQVSFGIYVNAKPVIRDPIEGQSFAVPQNDDFTHQFVANELDEEQISYFLVQGHDGASIGESDGLFRVDKDYFYLANGFEYKVKVEDSNGNYSTVNFKLRLNSPPSIEKPIITLPPDEPSFIVDEGGVGYLDVDATDPEGDPITYSIENISARPPMPIPTDITIDDTTGEINWNPMVKGFYTITVKAADQYGQDTITFSVYVHAKPEITFPNEVDPVVVSEDDISIIAIIAKDDDNDIAEDGFNFNPPGSEPEFISINANSGVITVDATDASATLGDHTIYIKVTDQRGNVGTLSFILNINAKPVIDIGSPTRPKEGKKWTHNISVDDGAEDDIPFNYEIIVKKKNELGGFDEIPNPFEDLELTNGTRDAKITWLDPTGGEYKVTITVTDSANSISDPAEFVIDVKTNPVIEPPDIVPPADNNDQQINEGDPWELLVIAYDLDVDYPFTFDVKTAIKQITGDSSFNTEDVDFTMVGEPGIEHDINIAWDNVLKGKYEINLKVIDSDDQKSAKVTFNLIVNAKPTITYPTGTISEYDNALVSGITISEGDDINDKDYAFIQIVAYDEDPGNTIESYSFDPQLTEDLETWISLDQISGIFSLKGAKKGLHDLTVKVTDNHGAAETSAFTLHVNAKPDITDPATADADEGENKTITITGKDDDGGAEADLHFVIESVKLNGTDIADWVSQGIDIADKTDTTAELTLATPQKGTYTFSLYAENTNEPKLQSETHTLTLTVNARPEITGPYTANANEDEPKTITITGKDDDGGAEADLHFVIESVKLNGTDIADWVS